MKVSIDEIGRRAGWSDPLWRFQLFCCPSCRRVYLYEEEYGEAWLDPEHLERTVAISGLESFPCEGCARIVLFQPFGMRDPGLQPTTEEVASSGWSWAMG